MKRSCASITKYRRGVFTEGIKGLSREEVENHLEQSVFIGPGECLESL